MIRGTVVIQASPRGMAKQFRNLVKEGLQDLVSNVWHRLILPGHFEPSAKRKYKYAPRSVKYLRYKAKKKPMAGPLEFSGRSKEMLTRKIRVSGTAKRARGVMRAPRYFYMTPANQPNKPEELLAVNKKEVRTMAEMLNRRVTKRLGQINDRQVIR